MSKFVNLTENEEIACTMLKEQFTELWDQIEDRPGLDNCLQWLENETDFFAAPASTKYHSAEPGGLCRHSLNVCDALFKLLDVFDQYGETEIDDSSIILVTLLHDVCKTNFYSMTTRRQRAEDGSWQDVRAYMKDDAMPMGHGEKSLYLLLQTGLKLTDEEAAAIRWHMGAYHDYDQRKTLDQAFQKYPLALFLHLADMIASQYYEKES